MKQLWEFLTKFAENSKLLNKICRNLTFIQFTDLPPSNFKLFPSLKYYINFYHSIITTHFVLNLFSFLWPPPRARPHVPTPLLSSHPEIMVGETTCLIIGQGRWGRMFFPTHAWSTGTCFWQKIGSNWISKLSDLRKLDPLVSDEEFVRSFIKIKQVLTIPNASRRMTMLVEECFFIIMSWNKFISYCLCVAGEQAEIRALPREGARPEAGPKFTVRLPSEASARVQATAAQRSLRDHAIQPHQAQPGRQLRAAHGVHRRQGTCCPPSIQPHLRAGSVSFLQVWNAFALGSHRRLQATTWPSWSSRWSLRWVAWWTTTRPLPDVWSSSFSRTTASRSPRRSSPPRTSRSRSRPPAPRPLAPATWSSWCVILIPSRSVHLHKFLALTLT